jgi:hypothetical protein
VRAHRIRGVRLVDVVAEKGDEIHRLLREVTVRGIEALLVMLARRERESQPILGRFPSGEGAGPPDRRRSAANIEAIPVPTIGLEAVHLRVHRMREVWRRNCFAALHHPAHRFVRGHFPAHVHIRASHPAPDQRIRRQARPEHDAIGQRIP